MSSSFVTGADGVGGTAGKISAFIATFASSVTGLSAGGGRRTSCPPEPKRRKHRSIHGFLANELPVFMKGLQIGEPTDEFAIDKDHGNSAIMTIFFR